MHFKNTLQKLVSKLSTYLRNIYEFQDYKMKVLNKKGKTGC